MATKKNTVKISNTKIEQMLSGMKDLLSLDMNPTAAFRVGQIYDDLEVVYKRFKRTEEDTLIRYCEKDDDGKPKMTKLENGMSFEIPEEKREEVNQVLEELRDAETPFEHKTFTIKELGLPDKVKPSSLRGLGPFLKG